MIDIKNLKKEENLWLVIRDYMIGLRDRLKKICFGEGIVWRGIVRILVLEMNWEF